MFGSIGGAELLLVLVVALLLFGPRKLPQIGRTIGRGLSEFRRASNDFKVSLEREVDLDSVREAGNEVTQAVDEVKSLSVPRGQPSRRDAAPARSEPAERSAPGVPAAEPDDGRSTDS